MTGQEPVKLLVPAILVGKGPSVTKISMSASRTFVEFVHKAVITQTGPLRATVIPTGLAPSAT